MPSSTGGQPASVATISELLGWLAAWPPAEESLTATDLADLLWLARTMPAAPRPTNRNQLGHSERTHTQRHHPDSGHKGSSKRPPPLPPPEPPSEDHELPAYFPQTPPSRPKERAAHLLPDRVLPRQRELDAAIASLPVRLQTPRLLPPERLLLEALRPLMERVPAADRQLLDEEATAERCAEQRLPMPVYGGRPEPRFGLTLLVDRGLSMEVWQPLAGEFRDLLVRSGAFREVRMVELIPASSWGGDGAVGLRPVEAHQVVWKSQDVMRRSPPPLAAEAQRSLVLVISDTAGPHWWDGLMFEVLAAWSRQLPVAILHTLPHWMAERTALRALAWAEIRNDHASVSGSRYLVRDPDGWDDSLQRGGALPVLSLDPGALAPWAALVMGDGRLSIAGVRIPADREVLDQQLEPFRPEALAPAASKPSGAEDLWQGFCHYASPEAQRLMMVLAAAPVLSLPVMRLIKEAMLPPESGPLPLQEVLLSGLLQPLAGPSEKEPAEAPQGDRRDVGRKTLVEADIVQYCFHAGVLELLRSDLSAADTVTVVRMVTGLLERRWNSLGTAHTFRALLRDPDLIIDDDALKGVVNFATATAELIERLPGEEYQRFARQLRGQSPQPPRKRWPAAMAFETHPFTTALLVEVPTLHTLPITTARWHDVPLQRVEFPTLRPADLHAFLQQVEEEGGAAARASLPTATNWAFHEPLGRDHLQPGDTAAKGHPLALTLVEIPAGTFLMGSPPQVPERSSDEGPQHEVTLASYFISQTPITQAQWRAVAGWRERPGERWGRELDPQPSFFHPLPNPNARSFTDGHFALLPAETNSDLRPVDNVSWHDAIEFCSRLSQRSGRTYTLPSEAQWEYACRAETTTPFWFGDTISPELANYDGNYVYGDGPKGIYRKQTTPVGMFPANAWGLQDMHGNVWEWCVDQWHNSYEGAPADGTAWADGTAGEKAQESQKRRLLRGGSWLDNPRDCRSAFRSLAQPGLAYAYVGFRVVCLPQGPSLNP
jgi:formylglycine-generating enzyme required for sulfatase activity